jgi:carbon-monoxide dehydrogenase small subunit
VNITCTLNGRRTVLEGHPMARLLDAIRQSGLTGTKEGCGEGECGACGVLLYGVLVNSCLTPLEHYEGSSITNIEGVSTDAKMRM